jgi:hypothetical protein
MNIATRLAKLERTTAARPRDCLACGAPSRIVLRCVETNHSEPMPTCHLCGRHLDFDGMPLPDRYKRLIRGGH